MERLASTLGPRRVCCLTGIVAAAGDLLDATGPRVYRRPSVFEGPKYRRAIPWGLTLGEIMVRERPQIVQLATAYDGYIGLWLRRWLKLPFLIYAHGNEILDAMRKGWDKPRLALRAADRVLANSRFTARLVQQAGVDAHRIEVLYLGCDTDHFQPLPAPIELRQRWLKERQSDRVLLTVGNLVPRKGQDMVIRALPRVRTVVPDVTYLVVGDGPYRERLAALAHELNVQDRVIFCGRVPDRELPRVYALGDVLTMPSREELDDCNVEGFGAVFLEANACERPVIGGRSGGVSDAIQDGVTGFLVDPRDPDDIAVAITRILTHPALARRMGAQGRARVLRNFTWQTTATRVQRICESIVQGGASRT